MDILYLFGQPTDLKTTTFNLYQISKNTNVVSASVVGSGRYIEKSRIRMWGFPRIVQPSKNGGKQFKSRRTYAMLYIFPNNPIYLDKVEQGDET